MITYTRPWSIAFREFTQWLVDASDSCRVTASKDDSRNMTFINSDVLLQFKQEFDL